MFPMTITVHNAEQLAAIQLAFAQETSKPQQTTSKPQTEKPAERVAETAAPVQDAPSEVSYDQLSAAVISLAQLKGRAVALEVLGLFDVTSAKELVPELYAEALAELKKAAA